MQATLTASPAAPWDVGHALVATGGHVAGESDAGSHAVSRLGVAGEDGQWDKKVLLTFVGADTLVLIYELKSL